MGSWLSFVSRNGVAREQGVGVRCISAPMVEINERIDIKTRANVRVPKHANVIRRILYGE